MQPLTQTRRERALLLATGQLTQYGGYPDDGSLRLGKIKRYTPLTTGQYAGATNIVLNGKTDVHSNNCVEDNNTGLMWSRTPVASVGPASDGLLPWTTNVNGEGIFAYVTAANAALLAGHNDWRVPNFFELLSIMDFEAPSSMPDSTTFPAWPTVSIWSATTVVSSTTRKIIINYLTGGIANSVGTGTITNAVVLVRGGR